MPRLMFISWVKAVSIVLGSCVSKLNIYTNLVVYKFGLGITTPDYKRLLLSLSLGFSSGLNSIFSLLTLPLYSSSTPPIITTTYLIFSNS